MSELHLPHAAGATQGAPENTEVHHETSDVDIRVYLRDWVTDSATAIWWLQQNQTDFSDLKAQLPGPLSIHREARDAADEAIALYQQQGYTASASEVQALLTHLQQKP